MYALYRAYYRHRFTYTISDFLKDRKKGAFNENKHGYS